MVSQVWITRARRFAARLAKSWLGRDCRLDEAGLTGCARPGRDGFLWGEAAQFVDFEG
jgi:hypothetical protein